MAQQLIVGLIVVAAALYLAWRYLPGRWRRGLARVHPGLAEAPGCGSGGGHGCSSCGSCAGPSEAGVAEKPVALPPRRAKL